MASIQKIFDAVAIVFSSCYNGANTERKWCDFTLYLQGTEHLNPKQLSPLTLAFLGDAVFELLVREELVLQANMPVGQLHHRAVGVVCAGAQSAAVEILEPLLTEEEVEIYKRGRNANAHHVPKNSDLADYRRATGLEALFGYLYLKGEQERIRFLYAAIRNHTTK